MFLKEKLLGLFFLFFCYSIFSQQKSINVVDYIGEESDEFYYTETLYKKEVAGLNINFKKSQAKHLEYGAFLNRGTVKKNGPENVVLNVLNLNSNYSDYGPSFYKGQLVFSSSRDMNRVVKSIDAKNDQPFQDLFTITGTSNDQKVSRLKGNINSKFHESSPAFSKDGNTMFFTRNNTANKGSVKNIDDDVRLKIYKASYQNGKWGNITELPFCSDQYSIAHPTLSPDGQYLYFASDMPGGYGKSDIYQVMIFENGKFFGTPQNLGPGVNTAGKETFPFMSDTGKLFFASDGHLGFGGLDVFVLMYNKSDQPEAFNLGKPINSTHDDFSFIINEESNSGYFASNRSENKGDDDIYGFKQFTFFKDYLKREPKTLQHFERSVAVKPLIKTDVFVSNED